MSRFDLIGIQEVMHPEHLQPLVKALEKATGTQWKVTSSRAVGGNGYKEGYAFVWRTDTVNKVGGDVLYMDPVPRECGDEPRSSHLAHAFQLRSPRMRG